MSNKRLLLVPRMVAQDLAEYWEAVNVYDDDSQYAEDNRDDLEAVRQACDAVEKALSLTDKPMLSFYLADAAAEQLSSEAENRLGIARDLRDGLHKVVEAEQWRKADALVKAYGRVLKQK